MTTSMCKVICITNRALCREDFLTRIERIAQAQPDAILLREKDLPEDAYTDLARRVQAICTALGVPLYLHSYPQAALALGAAHLHLPLPVLQEMRMRKKRRHSAHPTSSPGISLRLTASVGCRDGVRHFSGVSAKAPPYPSTPSAASHRTMYRTLCKPVPPASAS